MPITPNYPTSNDDTASLPDPGDNSLTDNPDHAQLHTAENQILRSLETKVGFGASTPGSGTAGYLLTSNADGSSSWQAPPAAGVWGEITGTLSNQTDLATALAGKLALTGGTLTGQLVVSSGGISITGNSLFQNLKPKTNNAYELGDPSFYWQYVYGSRYYLNSSAYIDGASAGVLAVTGALQASAAVLTNSTVAADPTVALGIASKQYVDNAGTTSLVQGETPGGTINGTNVNFTTASTYATGSLRVYLNGQRLASGSSNDYVEVSGGFTMEYAPLTGDVLLVDYNVSNSHFIQGSNSIIVNEVPSGTINGTTTLFTVLQGKYVANTLQVYLNGIQQTKTTDFSETTPGSGTFTFVNAPKTSDVLQVSYQFSTGASGNADTVDGFHASSTPAASTLLPLDSNGHSALPINLQAISTNSTPQIVRQTGWGYITGNGTNSITITVTFPVAFTSILNVLIGALGINTTTVPTNIGSFNNGYSGNIVLFQAYNITTTTMSVRGTLDSSATLASGIYAGFSWEAYGTI